MQPAEVEDRVVEEGGVGIVVDLVETEAAGVEDGRRACGERLEGHELGGLVVEGVELGIALIEAQCVGGESGELQGELVIEGNEGGWKEG